MSPGFGWRAFWMIRKMRSKMMREFRSFPYIHVTCATFARLFGFLLVLVISPFLRSRWARPFFNPNICDCVDSIAGFHCGACAILVGRRTPCLNNVYVPRKYLFFTFVAIWWRCLCLCKMRYHVLLLTGSLFLATKNDKTATTNFKCAR